MVVGIGTDITEVKRIACSIERHGDRFLTRIYTAGEIAYCLGRQKSSAESFAARFAAKEAGAKALGTGISRGVSWKELEVVRAPGHPPQLELSGRAAARAKQLGVTRISLSLTHTSETALAVVIMES